MADLAMLLNKPSFIELNARERVKALLDENS
ncbi:MAG: biotin-independent malonate decarboxylase subunit beta, partial [Acinetobacter sp.]